ncbi:hypothetical protein K458DRAFT_407795 [Lentithecium fluviatile CBS 122367]|uniref:Uncharacterized protein n=1 Tax=Lentithecium fluviatile CBS 122367 TaxID=1168545 RepID=A0A6G1IN59_9PLEO|nr:hypothetical protein K458DRAFT_407795 [Lentithecium fluviatile CBS 122367]
MKAVKEHEAQRSPSSSKSVGNAKERNEYVRLMKELQVRVDEEPANERVIQRDYYCHHPVLRSRLRGAVEEQINGSGLDETRLGELERQLLSYDKLDFLDAYRAIVEKTKDNPELEWEAAKEFYEENWEKENWRGWFKDRVFWIFRARLEDIDFRREPVAIVSQSGLSPAAAKAPMASAEEQQLMDVLESEVELEQAAGAHPDRKKDLYLEYYKMYPALRKALELEKGEYYGRFFGKIKAEEMGHNNAESDDSASTASDVSYRNKFKTFTQKMQKEYREIPEKREEYRNDIQHFQRDNPNIQRTINVFEDADAAVVCENWDQWINDYARHPYVEIASRIAHLLQNQPQKLDEVADRLEVIERKWGEKMVPNGEAEYQVDEGRRLELRAEIEDLMDQHRGLQEPLGNLLAVFNEIEDERQILIRTFRTHPDQRHDLQHDVELRLEKELQSAERSQQHQEELKKLLETFENIVLDDVLAELSSLCGDYPTQDLAWRKDTYGQVKQWAKQYPTEPSFQDSLKQFDNINAQALIYLYPYSKRDAAEQSRIRLVLQNIAEDWKLLTAIEVFPQVLLVPVHLPEIATFFPNIDPSDMGNWPLKLLRTIEKLARVSPGQAEDAVVCIADKVQGRKSQCKAGKQGKKVWFWMEAEDVNEALTYWGVNDFVDEEEGADEVERSPERSSSKKSTSFSSGDSDGAGDHARKKGKTPSVEAAPKGLRSLSPMRTRSSSRRPQSNALHESPRTSSKNPALAKKAVLEWIEVEAEAEEEDGESYSPPSALAFLWSSGSSKHDIHKRQVTSKSTTDEGSPRTSSKKPPSAKKTPSKRTSAEDERRHSSPPEEFDWGSSPPERDPESLPHSAPTSSKRSTRRSERRSSTSPSSRTTRSKSKLNSTNTGVKKSACPKNIPSKRNSPTPSASRLKSTTPGQLERRISLEIEVSLERQASVASGRAVPRSQRSGSSSQKQKRGDADSEDFGLVSSTKRALGALGARSSEREQAPGLEQEPEQEPEPIPEQELEKESEALAEDPKPRKRRRRRSWGSCTFQPNPTPRGKAKVDGGDTEYIPVPKSEPEPEPEPWSSSKPWQETEWPSSKASKQKTGAEGKSKTVDVEYIASLERLKSSLDAHQRPIQTGVKTARRVLAAVDHIPPPQTSQSDADDEEEENGDEETVPFYHTLSSDPSSHHPDSAPNSATGYGEEYSEDGLAAAPPLDQKRKVGIEWRDAFVDIEESEDEEGSGSEFLPSRSSSEFSEEADLFIERWEAEGGLSEDELAAGLVAEAPPRGVGGAGEREIGGVEGLGDAVEMEVEMRDYAEEEEDVEAGGIGGEEVESKEVDGRESGVDSEDFFNSFFEGRGDVETMDLAGLWRGRDWFPGVPPTLRPGTQAPAAAAAPSPVALSSPTSTVMDGNTGVDMAQRRALRACEMRDVKFEIEHAEAVTEIAAEWAKLVELKKKLAKLEDEV